MKTLNSFLKVLQFSYNLLFVETKGMVIKNREPLNYALIQHEGVISMRFPMDTIAY